MDVSQMLKGILEGCILEIISKKETYGYEMTTHLKEAGLTVSDGSIYPLLLKLQKEKLIEGEMKPSKEGPMRKYYHLTDKGNQSLREFKLKWNTIRTGVDQLMEGNHGTQ
ncbi:PadR family transcriptional regulator [Erysipelothrix larvae]|uniref:PadR family transcriptional regulator n=1 Tax=Erysipelothrix larvae TaxID=1514105 RepID=A0A0X8GZ53_9FIRM|nr:PadR family transcriptional regulator [Erysipelothrix larvae]AMC93097.1 PadR family transcriptional regulator [Erysipelothrix larvae]